ncbi:MAG: hypothetical protein AAGI68_12180 [Planctomycetota bacterium]
MQDLLQMLRRVEGGGGIRVDAVPGAGLTISGLGGAAGRTEGIYAEVTGDEAEASSGPTGLSWKRVVSDDAGGWVDDPAGLVGTGTAFGINGERPAIGTRVWLRVAGMIDDGSGGQVPMYLFGHGDIEFTAEITGGSGAYSWKLKTLDGTSDASPAVTGTDNAVDIQGWENIAAGTIVRMWRSSIDEQGDEAFAFDVSRGVSVNEDSPKDLVPQPAADTDTTAWDVEADGEPLEARLSRVRFTDGLMKMWSRIWKATSNGNLQNAGVEDAYELSGPAPNGDYTEHVTIQQQTDTTGRLYHNDPLDEDAARSGDIVTQITGSGPGANGGDTLSWTTKNLSNDSKGHTRGIEDGTSPQEIRIPTSVDHLDGVCAAVTACLKALPGYDASATQSLDNVGGALTWRTYDDCSTGGA